MQTKPNIDPLAGPAFLWPTRAVLAPLSGFEPDLWIDGDAFMRFLRNTYIGFDVATYSISKSTFTSCPLRTIRRLIYGLKQRGTNDKSTEKRFLQNNHIKLFLCYRDDILQDCFVGSQNLTHGTNLNLMYRVRDEHKQPLLNLFNTLWNQCATK